MQIADLSKAPLRRAAPRSFITNWNFQMLAAMQIFNCLENIFYNAANQCFSLLSVTTSLIFG